MHSASLFLSPWSTTRGYSQAFTCPEMNNGRLSVAFTVRQEEKKIFDLENFVCIEGRVTGLSIQKYENYLSSNTSRLVCKNHEFTSLHTSSPSRMVRDHQLTSSSLSRSSASQVVDLAPFDAGKPLCIL